MSITLNQEQRLYVIHGEDHVSCMGFDHVFDEVYQLAEILGESAPEESEKGGMELYQRHQDLITKYATSPASKKTWFHRGTSKKAQQALEDARKSGHRVRIWLGDAVTGEAWPEENDVIGVVGRSMGPMRIPLLCDARGEGGGAILDDCLVKITDLFTGKLLYKHPDFHVPEMTLEHVAETPENEKYLWQVSAKGKVVARFITQRRAIRFMAFLYGDSDAA